MHKTCAFTLRRLPGDVALQICASRTSDPSAFCFSCSSSKRKKKYGVFVMACFMLNAFLTGEDFHFDEASRITDPPVNNFTCLTTGRISAGELRAPGFSNPVGCSRPTDVLCRCRWTPVHHGGTLAAVAPWLAWAGRAWSAGEGSPARVCSPQGQRVAAPRSDRHEAPSTLEARVSTIGSSSAAPPSPTRGDSRCRGR